MRQPVRPGSNQRLVGHRRGQGHVGSLLVGLLLAAPPRGCEQGDEDGQAESERLREAAGKCVQGAATATTSSPPAPAAAAGFSAMVRTTAPTSAVGSTVEPASSPSTSRRPLIAAAKVGTRSVVTGCRGMHTPANATASWPPGGPATGGCRRDSAPRARRFRDEAAMRGDPFRQRSSGCQRHGYKWTLDVHAGIMCVLGGARERPDIALQTMVLSFTAGGGAGDAHRVVR